MLSRRQVIVSAGILTSAVCVGAYGLSLGSAAQDHEILSEGELLTIGAISMLIFPGDPMPLNGIEAGVPRLVDKLIMDLLEGPKLTGFRYGLRAFDSHTVGKYGAKFRYLTSHEQAEVLRAWSTSEGGSPRRLFFDVIKALLGMAYFSHPDILKFIGWSVYC